MTNRFDEVIRREGTGSAKWDAREELFGDKDVLPMWVADMDFLSPNPVVEAIRRRAEHGIYGYTIAPPAYHDAIVGWLQRRHGWRVQADWLKFSPGVVPALSLIIEAFTEPGDGVLIQSPVYYPFFEVIRRQGREIVNSSLLYEDGRYVLDFDTLAKTVDERVKLMLLCSPHNPVGRVWSKAELKQLGEFCRNRGIIVVSDEIHADIVHRPHVHTPMASISDELAQNTITCIAPSKTFNIAGLKTSNVIIPNADLRDTYANVLNRHFLDHHNAFGVVALEAAYLHGESWLEELLDYLQGNLAFLNRFVGEQMPELKVVQPEGTYLVWVDCRKLGMDNKALKQFMLKEARVALDEGYIFGPGGDGFERVNIACPRSILEDGLTRIATALRNHR